MRYAMTSGQRVNRALMRERRAADRVAEKGKAALEAEERAEIEAMRQEVAKLKAEVDALAKWKREREWHDEDERRGVA